MNDPNLIYKTKFAELTELLGRIPLTTDAGWLQLQEEYKKGWQPAEETVRAPRVRERKNERTEEDSGRHVSPKPGIGREAPGRTAQTLDTAGNHNNRLPDSRTINISAAGSQVKGFSRQPAPQASGMDEIERAREDTGECVIHDYKPRVTVGCLTCAVCGHRSDDPREGRGDGEATGEPGTNQTRQEAGSEPEASSGPPRIDERARGAGGGVLAVCEGCGQEWERERRRGRPARLCGECR